MKPERQRVAIAEACGWRFDGDSSLHKTTVKRWINPNGQHGLFLPDYLNDLNACHEMEETLMSPGWDKWVKYSEQLGWVGASPDRRIIHATAAQRCEAFLKTIGKWEETE